MHLHNEETDYYQELARLKLHRIWGFDLDNMGVIARPDLQDHKNSIGIEVVRSTCKSEEETYKWVESINDSDLSTNEKIKEINNSKKLRVKVITENNQIVSASWSAGMPGNPDEVIECIKKKIGKKYTGFSTIGLFVFVETTPIDENFDSYVMEIIQQVAEYKENYFEMIFLDQGRTSCRCDMQKKTFERKTITAEEKNQLEEEAKDAVHKNKK